MKTGPALALPYQPRELTRRELQRLDVYLFESPKLGRRVTVVRPASLALALQFEFDPDVTGFVERPRQLQLEGKQHQELSFWTTTRRGREQFHQLTALADGSPADARKREALTRASTQAQIALRLVFESDFLRQATANANRLRLLPYVQVAMTLSSRAEISGRIDERLQYQPRTSFFRLEQALNVFDPRDVRAVACSLIHAGKLKVEWSARLHTHSTLEAEVNV